MNAARLIFGVMAVLVLAGCVASRSVLDVDVAEHENPVEGQLVYLRNVSDDRVFQVDPPKPNIPSLKYDDDIKNKAITDRAIARKRNGWRKAMGDILLPEGETVAGLVRAEVTNSLRQVGYRVVDSEPEASDFSTLDVSVKKFWSWVNPGFWKGYIKFQGNIALSSHDPRLNMAVFADFEERALIAASSQWLQTVNGGLTKLGGQLRKRLSSTVSPSPVAVQVD